MAREITYHQQKVPPAELNEHMLAKMLAQHMYNLECLIKKMQRDIPKYVDEYLFAQNSTDLVLLPQSQNLECVTAVLAIVTASGGGTLTLGGSNGTRTINLPQGNSFFHLGQYGMLLNNGDRRELTQTSAGLLGLELFGFELPDKGVF